MVLVLEVGGRCIPSAPDPFSEFSAAAAAALRHCAQTHFHGPLRTREPVWYCTWPGLAVGFEENSTSATQLTWSYTAARTAEHPLQLTLRCYESRGYPAHYGVTYQLGLKSAASHPDEQQLAHHPPCALNSNLTRYQTLILSFAALPGLAWPQLTLARPLPSSTLPTANQQRIQQQGSAPVQALSNLCRRARATSTSPLFGRAVLPSTTFATSLEA